MYRADKIVHTDKAAEKAASERWNSVAKPLGSLGLLEDAVKRLAAIQGTADVTLGRRYAVVMCADNGVVREGVTQTDSSVTAICANAIADGTSNINAMADIFGTKVIAVDIGIERDMDNPRLLDRKIAYGTGNIAEGPAMTAAQAEKAVTAGMDIVRDLKREGADIIVTGEMGIGNTTVTSALSAVLLDMPPEAVTGRGAGLDSAGLERKINAVKKAILVNSPDKSKPMELLAKLGGFDVAGMTGLFLGGAYYKLPVVIDGVISAAAALLACGIAPAAAEYMLASHVSEEPAAKALLERIGLKPLLTAGMRLGEGTGGILLLPLLDGALAVYGHAHRFEELNMERYRELK